MVAMPDKFFIIQLSFIHRVIIFVSLLEAYRDQKTFSGLELMEIT